MPTILERYTAAKQAATELHNKAKSEDRAFTDAERTEFDALVTDATALKAQHERASQDVAALADLNDLADLAEAPRTSVTREPSGSWSNRFVASAEYKRLMASYPGGIPNGTQVHMGGVRVGDLSNTLVTDPGFTQPSVDVVRTPGYTSNLLDAISVVSNSPQVIKTFTATFTNNAADVAEGALEAGVRAVVDPDHGHARHGGALDSGHEPGAVPRVAGARRDRHQPRQRRADAPRGEGGRCGRRRCRRSGAGVQHRPDGHHPSCDHQGAGRRGDARYRLDRHPPVGRRR